MRAQEWQSVKLALGFDFFREFQTRHTGSLSMRPEAEERRCLQHDNGYPFRQGRRSTPLRSLLRAGSFDGAFISSRVPG
jgi:hypothetical protein